MRSSFLRTLGTGLTVALLSIASGRAEETIKVAFIEPFSGNLAEIGDADLKDTNFISVTSTQRRVHSGASSNSLRLTVNFNPRKH
jgi:hypothetical protein